MTRRIHSFGVGAPFSAVRLSFLTTRSRFQCEADLMRGSSVKQRKLFRFRTVAGDRKCSCLSCVSQVETVSPCFSASTIMMGRFGSKQKGWTNPILKQQCNQWMGRKAVSGKTSSQSDFGLASGMSAQKLKKYSTGVSFRVVESNCCTVLPKWGSTFWPQKN